MVSSKNNWIFYGKGLQPNYIARPAQIRWLLWIGKFITYITMKLEENEEMRDEKKNEVREPKLVVSEIFILNGKFSLNFYSRSAWKSQV